MKNRKLFAILTLVAFMLTMMPVMAFGATSNQITVWVEDGSAKIVVDSDDADTLVTDETIKANHKAIIGFDLPASDLTAGTQFLYIIPVVAGTNEPYTGTLYEVEDDEIVGELDNPYIIAEGEADTDADNFIYIASAAPARIGFKAVLVTEGTDNGDGSTPAADDASALSAAAVLNKVQCTSGDRVFANVTFDGTVTFTDGATHDNEFDALSVNTVVGSTGTTATASRYEAADELFVYGATAANAVPTLKANNGVDAFKVSFKLTKATQPVANAEVKVAVNKLGAEVSDAVVTTSNRGVGKFNIYATKGGIYKITLTAAGADKEEFYVVFDNTLVGSIVPVAPTGNFATDNDIYVDLDVTDANGNVVMGEDAVELVTGARTFVYTQAPDNSVISVDEVTDVDIDVNTTTGKAALILNFDAPGVYTLKMFNATTGSNVEYVTVNTKDYDETVQVFLNYGSTSLAEGANSGAATLTTIDANGTKITYQNGAYGTLTPKFAYTGVGVAGFNPTNGSVTVVNDTEKVLNKEIVVSVVVEECFATATLTIAAEPAYLQFGEVTAPVGTEVSVPVSSLDLNGNVASLGAQYAPAGGTATVGVDYVVTSKPAGSVVSVDTSRFDANKFVATGKNAIPVACNAEGTVTINFIITADVDGAGTIAPVYLTGISTINFGGKATPTQTSATLIIGSNVFVANGGVQTAPAAPVIIDGRTYLPIRAVGQSIGAQVDYVDGVITLTLGAQKATMVPGSNVMTVGTETVTMDAAPYLAGDGHTMVPVRYAAQAFGYELGTTTNADGSVATVTIFK